MCQECARIQDAYQHQSARLSAAQRELALFQLDKDRKFAPLWTEYVNALRELWLLREEMARHAVEHAHGPLSASTLAS